jgi:hypothetical protein|tara:strand:+ start:139 stop:984 length:846 start_codon:yes stop_codon:yes gene_type:complete
MKYIEYEVINKQTGQTSTFQVNQKFGKATPDNIVFKIEQNDITKGMFITPPDQRLTNDKLIKKLTPSIRDYGQLVPGTVLSDGTNAESNHRFKVCGMTGQPYKFVIDREEHGLTQEELTKEINVNQVNWEIGDWHNKWLVHGLEPYKRFDRFIKRNSFKQIYNALQVLSDKNQGAGSLRDDFENGVFDPTEQMWDNAERLMGELKDVSEIWNPGGAVFKSYFIGAYREVKFCSEFLHNTFLERMTKYLSEMRECAKSKDYIDLINSIYNKGLKRENKVWLA